MIKFMKKNRKTFTVIVISIGVAALGAIGIYLLILLIGFGHHASDSPYDLGGGYGLTPYDEHFLVDDVKYKYGIISEYNVRLEESARSYGFDDDFILLFIRQGKGADIPKNTDTLVVEYPVFYIIDKKASVFYGPLSLVEYLSKRDSLGVPDKLKLEI